MPGKGLDLVIELSKVLRLEHLNIKRMTVEAPVPGLVSVVVTIYPDGEQLPMIVEAVAQAEPDVVIRESN